MKKYTQKEIEEFLKESNYIERVHDLDSLKQAKIAWTFLINKKYITLGNILKVHKILMLNQPIFPDEKGYFRKIPVWVGSREGMEYDKIHDAIEHWVVNVNDLIINGKKESEIFLERTIKYHHVEYEKIHPFVDGNGRTGRIFMNWERMQLGLPILTIKADWPKIDGDQKNYYKWFEE